MHKKFIKYFADPITKEPLEIEITKSNGDVIESGILKSKNHKYPIIRGIPRFMDSGTANYSESFGYEWKKWPRVQFESENVRCPMEGYTTLTWENVADLKSDLAGQTILDVGCGSGRFIEVARRKGAQVIGIDYSSAVEVAAENFRDDPGVCICQGDALNLPIKTGALDGAFTIGVLHHTPEPRKGIDEAYRALKKGGWFALSVYNKNSYYDFGAVKAWRCFFKFLQPVFKHYPPLIYTYITVYGFRPVANVRILGRVIKTFMPFVSLPDIKWSLLDTFDSVTPCYQSTHGAYEVFDFFRKSGFVNIEPTNSESIAFKGTKP